MIRKINLSYSSSEAIILVRIFYRQKCEMTSRGIFTPMDSVEYYQISPNCIQKLEPPPQKLNIGTKVEVGEVSID
jgi:hypothetical protein